MCEGLTCLIVVNVIKYLRPASQYGNIVNGNMLIKERIFWKKLRIPMVVENKGNRGVEQPPCHTLTDQREQEGGDASLPHSNRTKGTGGGRCLPATL